MMFGLILIYKRHSLKVKMEIYYQIMGIITKAIFKSLFLWIVILQEIMLENTTIESLLMICTDGRIQQY